MPIVQYQNPFDQQSRLDPLVSIYGEDDEDDEDEEDGDDANNEERKAAVQAAMMGTSTQNNQSKSYIYKQGLRMDTEVEDVDQDDSKSCDLRMDLEELIKIESDEEEQQSLEMDSARTIQFDRNQEQVKHHNLEQEEANHNLNFHQVFNLSSLRSNSSQEFFMKDKPGVAGLPIKGPNSTERPVYVNPKQYDRIMKRRIARARLEEMGRLSRERKPYLHESRHKHALRRPRGPRGRFLTKEELAAEKTGNSPGNPDLENMN